MRERSPSSGRARSAPPGAEPARRDYADVVLVDIKGLLQGKALDINQAAAVLGYEANVTGSNGYEETAGSRWSDHGGPPRASPG